MKKYLNRFSDSYFLLYTVLSLFVISVVFGPFLISGTSLVWIPDTAGQHFTSFVYYGRYLREIARNFMAGSFVIPQYDFSIGFGSDILTTLHYYAIGDPLNLISALIPVKYSAYGYTALMLFRYYLAGLAFMLLAKYKRLPASVSACGAQIYAFSAYALYMAVRHPSFLNPFIYFPLIILGTEMIFDKKRPYVFILSICTAALSSFYFFYVLSLFTVFYIFVRLFFQYKEKFIKNFFICFAKFGGSYILGIIMAAAVFVPVIISFLSSSRGDVEYGLNLFYDRDYYRDFIAAFAGTERLANGTYMGYTALGLCGVILLFTRKKQHRFLKTAFIVLTVMMMFPVVSKVTNGFSYSVNRWTWAYGLLTAFIFVSVLSELKSIRLKSVIVLCCGAAVFGMYMLFTDRLMRKETFICVFVFAAFILICLIYAVSVHIKKSCSAQKAGRLFQLALAGITVISSFGMAVDFYNFTQSSVLNTYMSFEEASAFAADNGFNSLKQLQNTENAVERYEEYKPELGDANNSLLNKTYSTQEYFSLVNPNINSFQSEMGLVYMNYSIVNSTYADPFIFAAENTKYYVSENKNGSYFGFYEKPVMSICSNLRENCPEKNVYENKNYIPFGFTYKNVISAADYNSLNSAKKRNLLVNAVVLNDTDAYVNSTSDDFRLKSTESQYEMICDEGVKIDGNKIYAEEDGTVVTLKTKTRDNSQLYCVFNNITFRPLSRSEEMQVMHPQEYGALSEKQRAQMKQDDKNQEERTNVYIYCETKNRSLSFGLCTPYHDYYSAIDDFTANLGYNKTGVDEIKIILKRGVYEFDSIDIVDIDMNGFENCIAELGADVMTDVKFEADKVSGKISLDESKVLYLSIPYSEYWSVTVDGKEAELLRANTAFSAVALDAGEHTVELNYRNTGIDKSMLISVCGFAGFAAVAVIYEIYNKKRKHNFVK